MNTGLTIRDEKAIYSILAAFPSVSKVLLFGSRAKGNFHPGSDVDLAFMDEEISEADLRAIRSRLDDSDLPYFVDVIHYPSLTFKPLKEHIDRVGVTFYETGVLTN
jgi:uncharacterized protein